jgi:hypothetical protein
MKNSTRKSGLPMLLLVASLGFGPGFASAGEETSAADIRRETGELLEALKSYGAEQRDEAIDKSQSALDSIDRRIEALESHMLEKWDEMDQAARDKTRASLQALREQRTRVAEWYGSLKTGSSNAWEQIRQGFSSAYESMLEAWEKSEGEIRPDK